MITPASLGRGFARCHDSPQIPDFPGTLNSSSLRPEQPFSGRVSPHASSRRISTRYWNMNQFPIDYASRPRLRGRLTLGRLPLPRKPSAFGGQVFHLSFRYSYRHPPFRHLQQALQLTFFGIRNAPLPLRRVSGESRDFGSELQPRCIISARLLDQ